jgi:hypothetical protein
MRLRNVLAVNVHYARCASALSLTQSLWRVLFWCGADQVRQIAARGGEREASEREGRRCETPREEMRARGSTEPCAPPHRRAGAGRASSGRFDLRPAITASFDRVQDPNPAGGAKRGEARRGEAKRHGEVKQGEAEGAKGARAAARPGTLLRACACVLVPAGTLAIPRPPAHVWCLRLRCSSLVCWLKLDKQ